MVGVVFRHFSLSLPIHHFDGKIGITCLLLLFTWWTVFILMDHWDLKTDQECLEKERADVF